MQNIVNALSAASGWAESHPALFAAVVWPFVLGLLNLLFKPKTPDEYAAVARFSPRLAGFLQLLGTLGIDPTKAATVLLEKVVKGNGGPPASPPAPPVGPTILPSNEVPASGPRRLAALIVGAILLVGCAAFQKVVTYLPTPEQDACVIMDVERGITDPLTVIGDCHLVDWAVDDVRRLIAGAERAKAARPKAAGCAPDAGAK
jgi:hypothetical protein